MERTLVATGAWQGRALNAREFVVSADEKSSIQARRRKQPTLAPASGRSTRVEHEYFREGAWTYLAAWDVPLDNGEVNFNLIEPTGMDRGVYEKHVGPLRAEAVDRLLAAIGGAVVHDPEDAPC